MPLTLLLGLILIVLAFALVRVYAPAWTLPGGVLLCASALALMAVNHHALLSLQFWSGLIGFVAILSALLVVIHPNPMVSILFLIVNLICIALFYLILNAQFLAVLQLIIYAGAIMVLFVFVVMLLNLRSEEGLRIVAGPQRWGAVLLAAAFALVMFHAVHNRSDQPYVEPGAFESTFGSAGALGELLFSRYLVAFEAASLLLLAGMIGAVVVARRRVD